MTTQSLPGGVILRAVLVGNIEPLGQKRPDEPPFLSAINKLPVDRPIMVGSQGFVDDHQANRKHHGGPDRAVHIYPFDHYIAWQTDLGEDVMLLQKPGAFGENLSTEGMVEKDIHLGDILRMGKVLFQVSQGRQPCSTLDMRFGRTGISRQVLKNGRTGWYFRVLETGLLGPGDTITLMERPLPDWPITRLQEIILGKAGTTETLAILAGTPELSEDWRATATKKLASLVSR